jgi:bifunctional NMN adenylyltransferase/nudix hydrolase
MSEKNYELAILIGRQEPHHLAHNRLMTTALRVAQTAVMVLGSAYKARDIKNPFTWTERKDMIELSAAPEDQSRLSFIPVRDYYDDDTWVAQVKSEVKARFPDAKRIALVGHFKDASSDYLNRFKDWDLVEEPETLYNGVSATNIRNIYFSPEASWPVAKKQLSSLVPTPVLEYLALWRMTPAFQDMQNEWVAREDELSQWKGKTPYPVNFVTVDAVVTCNKHVLLLQRKNCPGRGLWAVPGGHLEPADTLLQSALRELHEETCLGLLDSDLTRALTHVEVFGHPGRSVGIRRITHAHYFDLGELNHLPEVRPGNDGEVLQVKWVPEAELSEYECEMFEDHSLLLARRGSHR